MTITIIADQLRKAVEKKADRVQAMAPPTHPQLMNDIIDIGRLDKDIKQSLKISVRTTRWYLFPSRPGNRHIATAVRKFATKVRMWITAINEK
jgi:hypothetical protein